MTRFLFIISFVLITLTSFAQQTLKVMTYNLLNYGNYWGNCTIGNNNIISKNAYIHTIVDYVKPDIFAAVEVKTGNAISVNLLNNALNIYGETKWKKGNPMNFSGAYLVNQIFYNSEKVQLENAYNIQTSYRDIVIYRFSIIDDPSGNHYPLNCIVAHLKAGQGYAAERKIEAELLMNFLDSHDLDGNNLLMGDFNFYKSSEPGYLQFLNFSNAALRFYDPIHKPGNWNNNSIFKHYHTQSTHTQPSCPAGGGMDDRFDFILSSDEILNGSLHVRYVNNTYKTIGQDGNHFNKAINQGSNNSVPSNVLSALYNNSDHLPVSLTLEYGSDLGITDSPLLSQIRVLNPATNKMQFAIPSPLTENLSFQLFDIMGKVCHQGTLNKSFMGNKTISIESLNSGLYALLFTSTSGHQKQFKILVVNHK